MGKMLDYLKSLSRMMLSIVLGGAALLISVIIILFLWSQGTDYQILYSRLSPEDSGAVMEKLKEKKIPYKIEGPVIYVPADRVYETRMELAGEGLPQGGGVGFEIFDKSGFGVTDFVQKINYKRALQGELARTIAQIKEIEGARVHLVMPDKGVFLDEQKKARASIVVRLKPGKSLTPGQVSAIVHLVSNSVDNLKPGDITVVDTMGKMWTRASGEDGIVGLSSSQLEYKTSIEKDLESRVQSMLEKVVGANKAVARVSVDLDNRQVERTEETYDPESQVKRSEQKDFEKTIGGTPGMGVPGVLSNMPGQNRNRANANLEQPQSQRENDVVNYEINKVVSHVVEPVGSIKRLTVSVLVDGIYEVSKDAKGKEVRKFVPRDDKEIAKYTDMVKAAVGFSEKRGDVITVVSSPFEAGVEEGVVAAIDRPSIIEPYMIPMFIKYASVLLVVVLLVLFIVRPLVKVHVAPPLPADLRKSLSGGGTDLSLEAGNTADDAFVKIRKQVKDNPQQVAMVLKGWLREE